MVTSSMEKLKNAFVNVLGMGPDDDFESMAYGQTSGWDSVAHGSDQRDRDCVRHYAAYRRGD